MATAPPLIGVTTYREQARWGVWDTSTDLLPSTYARAVQHAGGVPVLLPPLEPGAGPVAEPGAGPGAGPGTTPAGVAVAEAAAAVVARLDGLLVSGGADIAPARYAEEPHPRTGTAREDRDAWDLALLDAADRAALPVLGVCRGMQVLAVWGGGTLEQHLPDRVGHEGHDPGGPRYGSTTVTARPGTRVHRLVGAETRVHCHHHQAVRTHPGFAAVAWAEDGTVEGMEREGSAFWLGVQWHPEEAVDRRLFRGLVEAAADRIRA